MLSHLKTSASPEQDWADAHIFDNSPLPLWIIDPDDFRVVKANEAAARQYGFSVKELPGLNFLNFFPEEGRISFFQKAIAPDPGQLNGHYRHQNKSGNILFVQLFASCFIHAQHTYLQVATIDQTPTQAQMQFLEEEKQRYKTFFEQSSEGIFCQEFTRPLSIELPEDEIIDHVRQYCFLSECNEAMAQMYGYENPEDLIGFTSEQLIDFTDPLNIEYLRFFIKNGFKVVRAESHEKDRHGHDKYFLNSAIAIIEDGFIQRIWGIQQDITEKKKTEKQLRILASLVEQTSDVLTSADLDYRPVTWNQAAEKVYGLKAEDVIGQDVSKFLSLHYEGTNRAEVRKTIFETGEWRGEAWFVRPTDQKTITLWMSFKLMKSELNHPMGYLVSATDITARKESEQRLTESERRFREMADSTPVMIWMCDEHNRVNYLNKKWMEFTGKNVTDSEGWISLVHEDDLRVAKNRYDRAFRLRERVSNDYRLKTAEGNYRWVQDICVPRFLNDGTFVGYIGSVVDLEDRKLKQEQLQYQATILENVSDIVVTTDTQFIIREWNKAAERYYELPASEAIGQRIGRVLRFQFGEHTTEEEAYENLLEHGFWEGEVSRHNSRGEVQYFLHTVKFLYDIHGGRIGFLVMGRDISEKKRIEEQLQKSEQFYRALIADSLDGTILVNSEGMINFSSLSVKNVLGFEVDEVVGRNVFEFVHPDDLFWAVNSFEREVVENPEVKFITVRLLKKGGDYVWCMVRGHNLLKNPYINSIAVYFHDDSLRKKANDALKESEKRFRHLIRDLQIGVILQDREGKTILCNNAFQEMFQATEAELIGQTIQKIALDPIHEDGRRYKPEDRPTYRAIHTRQPAKDVVMGIRRPGKKDRIWILVNADPILQDNGEILHIICSVKDITERKKMEKDQLFEQMAHQRALTQATIDGQEAERREIGKELHDNIGQQLTTIKLFLDMAKTTATDPTDEMVNMALKGVSDVINEVRAMSRSLVPFTLKDLGLVESINELADSIRRTQLLQIHFEHFGVSDEQMPENLQLTIFRIIQEQLNNIVKHAKASTVTIGLKVSEQQVLLEVIDNGVGFELAKVRKGLGFVNIKNRVALFGGTVGILAEPGEGCLLAVSFPQSKPRGRQKKVLPDS